MGPSMEGQLESKLGGNVRDIDIRNRLGAWVYLSLKDGACRRVVTQSSDLVDTSPPCLPATGFGESESTSGSSGTLSLFF